VVKEWYLGYSKMAFQVKYFRIKNPVTKARLCNTLLLFIMHVLLYQTKAKIIF